MCLVMYLLDDLPPLYFLHSLMISEELLRPLYPLDLGAHGQMLLNQLLFLQLAQPLI